MKNTYKKHTKLKIRKEEIKKIALPVFAKTELRNEMMKKII